MQGIQVVPLTEEHREGCAELLADRYARQRAAEPLLPEIERFGPHIPETGGVVALRGGKLVAYVAGELQGDTATVGFAGCAALVAEAVRDCFATLAVEWGVRRFAVAVPASDRDLLDAWFRLAFGCQFYWGVRPSEEIAPAGADVLIRPATPDDLEAEFEAERILWELQTLSPSFSGREAPSLDQFRVEWDELLAQPETYAPFVAERDGRAVGHSLLYHRPAGDLRVPEANLDLAHMVTLPEVRGTGVGRALTEHALTYAAVHDCRSVTIVWRSVNLLASRFWPRRGFRPQYLRLYRAIP